MALHLILGHNPTPVTVPSSSVASLADSDTPAAAGPSCSPLSQGTQDTFVSGPASLPASSHSFDPAGDVLPTLSGLNPLTYETAKPEELPYRQASERDLVEKVRAEASPAEFVAAKRLSDTGTSSMWTSYAAQYAAMAGPLKAAELDHVMCTVMNADMAAYSLGKQEHPEPRPFEIGKASTGDSYPSGHASTAYAAATVLAKYWPERAQEFYQAAANVARSRVLLDMHFAGDVAAGARLGVEVAKQVMDGQQTSAA